ncbi:putative BLI-3 blue-light-inducible Bli-3 protein [Microdochium trichocladiopsis]|uniref:BLI-3 blue-light-inducible Bli-3 protein n=1 Tax=Microdochium trichocladiopsis TaxID=1682393 RepID=A0A9P8Y7M0_9PEZI|nr:putative BLI-3 blue-light-inducible Bli-3 protein [Microdochium trichocladiopsis]KAH7031630.1 putative BLI-3 blue-light-inducible Bli-3 protein [Microdochium trichocladiopsis]
MSSYSNTDTGSKTADPYKAANKDEQSAEQKITALTKFISSTKFGMMTTRDLATGRLVSRCMAVAAKENAGIDLLFFTNTESGKTDEIKFDSHTNVSFLDSNGQWASVSGTSTIETDRALIREHYTPTLKAWVGDLGDGTHDGSENDPRIGIIRVKTETATYSVSDSTLLGFAIEVAKGAVTGRPANVAKLREISESEISQWRSSH